MDKIKAFPLVIDILSSDPDYRAIVIQIAKENPQAILRAELKLKPEPVHPKYGCEGWYKLVAGHILNKKQIQAIKELKTVTGYSLRCSKEICNDIRLFAYEKNLLQDGLADNP